MKRWALVAGTVACGCNGHCAGWNLAFERMVEQPKYLSYSSSQAYSDGRAMRAPPEGTVATDDPLGPLDLTQAGAPDKPVDHFPLPLTDALMARGRDRFDIYCAPCHGVAGDGDSVVATRMTLRRPPSLGEDRLRRLTPGALYRVVQHGYGLMPAYQQQLSVTDRWAVVAYVRALQMSMGVRIVALPEPVRARALRSLGAPGG